MRRLNQADYLHKGLLYSKNFNTNTYAELPQQFRFKEIKVNKDSGQLLQGFTHTDGSTVIETVSPLEFKRGDNIVIGADQYKITNIELVEFMPYGEIRKIKRYKKVISLT